MKLDPIIEASNISSESKQIINHLLMEEFGGDWDLLLKDMEEHAVSDEEYELAAEIRDYLKQNK
tara:strand:- start:441 stop:632 length:192 start_codon:yes stop_codon:yes gene_type:complete